MAPASATPPSKLSRALPASIFLILSATCFYLMDILHLVFHYPSPSESGFIEPPNTDIKVPILQKFHLIPFLDEVFRDVTMGFWPSTFGYDDVSRWQLINFMNDIGVLYAIWGLESERRGNKGTIAYYPTILGLIAQLGGGGVIIPIQYFLFIVFCPPTRVQSPVDRKIDLSKAWVWLPLILLFHTLPAASMYFGSTLEERHYWTWYWQLYTVRITIAYYAFQAFRQILPFSTPSLNIKYTKALFFILVPLITLCAGFWLYTLKTGPYPPATIFLPSPLVEESWSLRMRRILQFDQLFIFGCNMLWLGFLFLDMSKYGRVSPVSIGLFLVLAVVFTVALGPGGAFGAMWLYRESLLAKIVGDEGTTGKRK